MIVFVAFVCTHACSKTGSCQATARVLPPQLVLHVLLLMRPCLVRSSVECPSASALCLWVNKFAVQAPAKLRWKPGRSAVQSGAFAIGLGLVLNQEYGAAGLCTCRATMHGGCLVSALVAVDAVLVQLQLQSQHPPSKVDERSCRPPQV